MKKSLLNITVTMALSSAVFSGSVLSTHAYADEMQAGTITVSNNNNSIENTSESYLYPGMGVGAAAGTLVAGPIGLVIGGAIGALIGSNQEVALTGEKTETEEDTLNDTFASSSQQEITESEDSVTLTDTTESDESDAENGIQLAQLGPINTVIETGDISSQEKLMNILVTDLSLDVYFRSGSSDIEKFYPARLAAIADLVNTMDKLELHLDGYTDRRGDREQNIALANKRIEKVREQLISAGVDENRIIGKAFGEARMTSDAGNLEAYTFDRRVVIRFERARTSMSNAMAAVFATTEYEEPTVSVSDEIADAATRF